MPTPKSKTWFEFRNSGPQVAEIAIMDEIGGWGVSAQSFIDQLKRIGNNVRIKLHIYSPGGDVTAGNEIYNALKAHPAGVDVTIGALCASIATVVAMAGTTITMAANGLFMIHNPYVCAYGESDELRKMADVMDKLKDGIVSAYKAKTGMSEDDLSAMMTSETWMTADEAKEKGFIDSITDQDEDAEEVQDRLQNSRFKNALPAISRIRSKFPQARRASASTAPKPKNKQSILESYMAGKVRIFNSLASIDADGDEDAEKKAQDLAQKLYKAKLKRDGDIDAVVARVKERDGKDFSNLATEFKAEDKSEAEFCMAITTSDKFTKVSANSKKSGEQDPVVGGGLELIEPLDSLKGTPGYAFVVSNDYKAAADLVRGNKSQFRGRVITETPSFNNAMRAASLAQFRNASATSITTASIDILPGVVEQALRPLYVEELFSAGQTDSRSIRYVQQTAFTQAAGFVAETGTLTQADFTFTPTDAPVQAVGDFIPLPEELLADFPAVASLINMQLPYMVDRAVDDQLLNGDGTGNNLTGALNIAGLQTLDIAVANGSTSPALDLALKMLTKIRWQYMTNTGAQAGWEPDGYIFHPTDWEFLTLMKDAVGQFYRVNPFQMADGQERLWGKRVCVSPVTAQGTVIAGAFKTAGMVFSRQGMVIEMTNSDGTNFQKRIITLRAARRLALALMRPGNICQGTGVNPQP